MRTQLGYQLLLVMEGRNAECYVFFEKKKKKKKNSGQ